ncbi:MAG: hypothetical protein JSW20_12835 [Nitrospiraceae bacterium]|nr:MAG: hypothetical protein JSW20_12835 [Nitrospiraceae bacterium]
MPPLKKKITALLENRDFQGISSLPASPYKIVNSLISLTYDKKSTVAWRAMEAVGLFTGSMAKQDTEFVRNIVGRLLWMIRDESGGIGWSVPEMLGEIVRNNPVICSDIALVLISFYEELMLATGVLWAAGSMGRVNEETAAYAVPLLRPFLNSSEAIQRGYAARALGALGASRYKTDIEGLIKDDNLIPVYHDGEIHEKTVGDMAAEALSIL